MFQVHRRKKIADPPVSVNELPVPPPLPRARQGHVAALLERRLVVFGGRVPTTDQRDGPRSYANDVLVFDWSSGAWTLHDEPSVASWPAPRHNHAACALRDGSLFVSHGSGAAGFFDDVWLLQLDRGAVVWVRVPRTEPWPAARHGHACGLVSRDGRDFVVLSGGHSGRQSHGPTYHGDVWLFDVAALRWARVDGTPQPHMQRSWHSMVVVGGDQLLIAFGYTFRGREIYFGDLWLIELELAGDKWRAQWRPVQVTGGDAEAVMVPRNRVAMCALDDSRVFAWGGNEFDGSRDEFYDLPSILAVDLRNARAAATLLRNHDSLAPRLKLGHAVAVRWSDAGTGSAVVAILGGEKSRVRLDSVFCVQLE